MGRESIRKEVLQTVIAGLRSPFATKDVSEDERVRDAHPAEASHSHYHAFVGGALSDHRVSLGIEEMGKGSRGSIWRKK